VPAVNSDYLDFNWDGNGTLEVTMKKDLSEYRLEDWIPSIETEFTIACADGVEKQYSFLLLVKDENVCEPRFEAEAPYNFSITAPWMEDQTINKKKIIGFYDCDYNADNANVKIECQGEDCAYIRIGEPKKDEYATKFHHFTVDLYLKVTDTADDQLWDDLLEKKELRFSLIANDGMHYSSIDVQVNIIDLGGRASSNYSGSKNDTNWKPIISVGSGLLAVVIGSMFALMYYKRKHRAVSKELKKLTASDIEEFFNGLKNATEVERTSFDANTPIFSLPYNTNYEISRDRLKVGMYKMHVHADY